jgi:hypothetical protein
MPEDIAFLKGRIEKHRNTRQPQGKNILARWD